MIFKRGRLAPLFLFSRYAVRMNQDLKLHRLLLAAFFLATNLIACTSMADSETAPVRAGRIMPSGNLLCDRNQLTSWTGEVTGYRRNSTQTWIEMHTDEATVESTIVDNLGQADASSQYLLWAQPFSTDDWSRIEQSEGVLHKGMRATAWICLDGKTSPVIDWQPPQD